MAKEVAAGVESSGCEVRTFQVAETLPAEVLAKMHAKEKNSQIPVIKVEQLPEADGILFGMPTRFGSAPTQMRALFDQCGGHWMSNALFGKPVSFLFHSLSRFHFNLTLLSYTFTIGRHLLLNRLDRWWPRNYGAHQYNLLRSSWDDFRTTRL